MASRSISHRQVMKMQIERRKIMRVIFNQVEEDCHVKQALPADKSGAQGQKWMGISQCRVQTTFGDKLTYFVLSGRTETSRALRSLDNKKKTKFCVWLCHMGLCCQKRGTTGGGEHRDHRGCPVSPGATDTGLRDTPSYCDTLWYYRDVTLWVRDTSVALYS